jgi:hypothetical protein
MPTPDENRHMEEVVLKLAGETTEPTRRGAARTRDGIPRSGYGITARRAADTWEPRSRDVGLAVVALPSLFPSQGRHLK